MFKTIVLIPLQYQKSSPSRLLRKQPPSQNSPPVLVARIGERRNGLVRKTPLNRIQRSGHSSSLSPREGVTLTAAQPVISKAFTNDRQQPPRSIKPTSRRLPSRPPSTPATRTRTSDADGPRLNALASLLFDSGGDTPCTAPVVWNELERGAYARQRNPTDSYTQRRRVCSQDLKIRPPIFNTTRLEASVRELLLPCRRERASIPVCLGKLRVICCVWMGTNCGLGSPTSGLRVGDPFAESVMGLY